MKDAILIVVGLAVGLAIGYALWGGDATANVTDNGGSKDVWLDQPCPPPPAPEENTTVQDKLMGIIQAVSAMPQPTAEAVDAMAKASELMMAQPNDPIAGSGHLYTAHGHATAPAPNWASCKEELDLVN